jgi:Flp pilus assembly pilin Flp
VHHTWGMALGAQRREQTVECGDRQRSWRWIIEHERGASLVEYALLLALIALVCVGAMQLLGNDVATRLSTVSGSLSGS